MSEFTIGISASLPAQAGQLYDAGRDEVLAPYPFIGCETFDPPSEIQRWALWLGPTTLQGTMACWR